MWKGRSALLQRIEFGEFEHDPLWQQSYLEDAIFEVKVEDIKKQYARSTQSTIDDRIQYERKKLHKRKTTMREKHMEAEIRLLNQLADELAKEFELTKEEIEEIMETFDGTTRHLYFHVMALKEGRALPDAEDVQMIPLAVRPQPRHIMKQSEGKWFPLWKKVATEKKIW